MRYGLLKYEYGILKGKILCNLGDDIQSLAAARFLPQIDYFIEREKLRDFVSDRPVKTIMNGWYLHNHKQWPPSRHINPLLISVHITQNPTLLETIFSSRTKNYFLEYGKSIGARDYATFELLQKNNIPAYFSGCLTLTLVKNEEISKSDYICAIDISDDAVSFLKTKTQRPIYRISPELKLDLLSYKKRFHLAKILLDIYQGAHCVVTGRLHAALPCTAFETPVLLLDYAKDQYRFSGLNEFVRHCSETELINGNYDFDFENPAPNPSNYLKYRENLINECISFTGIDNKAAFHNILLENYDEKNLLMEALTIASSMKGLKRSSEKKRVSLSLRKIIRKIKKIF